MSEGNQRWSVPTSRFGTSVVLGVAGVFVVCGSLGMDNLTVGAVGIALLGGAFGLYMISALNGRNFAYTPGVAHVVSASEPPASATRGRCNLHVIVTARNLSATAVKFRDATVPVAKWPDVGSNLPILVAVGNPRRVRVLWDDVRPHGAPPLVIPSPVDDGVSRFPSDVDAYATVDLGEPDTVTYVRGDRIGDPASPTVGFPAADPVVFDAVIVEPDVVEPIIFEPIIFEPIDVEPIDVEPIDVDDSESGSMSVGSDAGSKVSDLDDSLIDDEIFAFEPDVIGVTEADGRRTIELDVRDPKVLRWSPIDPTNGTEPTTDTEPTDTEPTDTEPTDNAQPTDNISSADDTKPADDTEPTDTKRSDGTPASAGVEPAADAAAAADTGSTAPTGPTASSAATAASSTPVMAQRASARPETPLPRRTPSPRARMGGDPPAGVKRPVAVPFASAATTAAASALPDEFAALLFDRPPTAVDEMPTIPLQFNQARVVTPAVTADPDAPPDALFDQAAPISDAYLAATPPPGGSTVSGRIRSVAVTLFVSDLSRSIIFYRDQLGFTESDAGRGSAVLVSGDARIVLRRVAMPPVERRLVQLLLEVPDVDAAYADLRARGLSFLHRPRPVGQYEQLTLWSAAFRDPDGHGIAVTQWRDA